MKEREIAFKDSLVGKHPILVGVPLAILVILGVVWLFRHNAEVLERSRPGARADTEAADGE